MKAAPLKGRAKRRVVVVDDHPLLREGVMQLVNRQSDLTCCGEADSVATAEAVALAQQPDLMLLDLRLGHTDALDLIGSLRQQVPQMAILVISQHDQPVYAQRALRAGARGYVIKQQATEEVLSAIRTVLAGQIYLSRKLGVCMLGALFGRTRDLGDGGVERLSDRELQVFGMLGAGLGTVKVATELKLSVKTIETYRETIKHKLGLRDAADLVRHATAWVERRPPYSSEPSAGK